MKYSINRVVVMEYPDGSIEEHKFGEAIIECDEEFIEFFVNNYNDYLLDVYHQEVIEKITNGNGYVYIDYEKI